MRFLFCAPSSAGYVYPMIGMALELRRRGHQTEIITGPEFDELLLRNGFVLRAKPGSDRLSFAVEVWATREAVRAQARQLTALLPAFFPNVIVGQQLGFAPLLIAEVLGIPIGILGFAAYLLPTVPARASAADDDLSSWRKGQMYKYYNAARETLRLPPVNPADRRSPLLGDLFLLQSVEALEGSTADLPANVRLVGSCLWEPPEPDPELDCWAARVLTLRDRRVYLQLGTAFRGPNSWTLLVEHLSGSPVQVVASTGGMRAEIGRLPPNFLAREHVRQGQVLPLVDAVISRATTTAVLGALTHGLPSLLIPSGGEQPDLARRCEAAGVAVRIDAERLTPEALSVGLRQLFEDRRLRENAQHLREDFARAGGCPCAADLLESLGRGGSLNLQQPAPTAALRPHGD